MVIAIGIPLASRVEGTGSFAYSMFSGNTEYRLLIVATGHDGARWQIAPSLLEPRVNPAARGYLASADRFRRTRSIVALRAHLADLAGVACGEPNVAHIELRLEEKPRVETLGEAAPVEVTRVEASCP